MPTPINAVDIYDPQEFLLSLAKLIVNNLYVSTWIFKIDDEFQGRGHASFSIEQIKSLNDLKKKQVEVSEELVDKVIGILTRTLPKKVKIATSRLYTTWNEYL